MKSSNKPKISKPVDFDKFWTKTLEALSRIPLNIKVSLAPGDIQENLVHEYVAFDSFKEARIHGYVIRWNDNKPRPLVVYTHGYLDQTEPKWDWAQSGMNVLGFDVRGFGVSQEAVAAISSWGYVLTGIQSPEDHVLRGAVCDFIRAIESGLDIFGHTVSRLVVQGTSFAGGLAMMAESLINKADLLSVATPTFGWSEGRYFLAEYGSGAEVRKYLDQRHEEAEDVMLVLKYFDTINFTEQIKVPTIMGIGLQDKVVPPETVYAIADHLTCPLEIMEFSMSHSRTLEEQRIWKAFEERWIALALKGADENFGH